MKAREVLERSLKIMGITDNEGNPIISKRVKTKATALINIVYSDLNKILGGEYEEIKSLDDNIPIDDRIMSDCFVYGLAMHIAFAESDADGEQYFSILYNQKRTSLNGKGKIVNGMPRSYDL